MDDARWSVWATTGVALTMTGLGATVALAVVRSQISVWWLAAPMVGLVFPGITIFVSAMFGWPIKRLAQKPKPIRFKTIGEWDRGEE